MMPARARWLIIVLLVVAVGAIELLSDTILDDALPFPWDTLVVIGVMACAATVGGHLAFRRIDRLDATLRERNAQLEATDAATRALNRVSISLSTLTDLDEALEAIVANARSLLDADVALLVLTRADSTPRLAARSGPADAFSPAGDRPGSDFARFVDPALVRTHLAAPVARGAHAVGTLAVGSRADRSFDVNAVETLASLAGQAAVAIENDQLHAQLRQVAVQGERERIAREMHDGLAQVLGYVNTKSQAVAELLGAGRLDAARAQLAELSGAARSVYVDVREAILGLGSPLDEESGLVDAVEHYAQRFSEASKLAVSVHSTGNVRALRLPAEAEAHAFRIIQEALTNVRKHAAAQRAVIQLASDPSGLDVTVEDDGRGFDARSAEPGDWPHLGIQGMRERAEAIGGTLDIGTIATGTRLHLHVPLAAGGLEAP
jgi:signal transduction histidine kinase